MINYNLGKRVEKALRTEVFVEKKSGLPKKFKVPHVKIPKLKIKRI